MISGKKSVCVRLTADEHERISAMAASHGLSREAYIRVCALGDFPKTESPHDLLFRASELVTALQHDLRRASVQMMHGGALEPGLPDVIQQQMSELNLTMYSMKKELCTPGR